MLPGFNPERRSDGYVGMQLIVRHVGLPTVLDKINRNCQPRVSMRG